MGISIFAIFMLWVTVLAIPWSSDDHYHHGGDDDCYNHGQSAHATPVQGAISQGTSCPGFSAPPNSNDDESNPGPAIPTSKPRGPILPSVPHVNLTIMDPNNPGNNSNIPKRQEGCRSSGNGVIFDTSTVFGTNGGLPSEPSGARNGAGNIIFSTANTLAAVSFDSGATFTTINHLDYVGANNPATDNGFCCDMIVQYIPSIDRFAWLLQYQPTAALHNKLRLITFHPSDITTSGINSWLYVDFLSTDMNLVNQLDAGELAVGQNYLWVGANNWGTGLVVWKVPLSALSAAGSFTYWYTNPSDSSTAYLSRLSQNPGDTIYWAGHSTWGSVMRIFKFPESGTQYFWNDVGINDWPADNTKYVANCPGTTTNWLLSADFGRVLGSTVYTANEIWFAWNAASGDTASGDKFANVHIQVAQINVASWPSLSLVKQWQVWNAGFAFAYPAFYTNGCGDVGMAVMFGSGSGSEDGFNPTGALGIVTNEGVLTQTVYYPELSDVCENRYGDYLTVRSDDGTDFEGWTYAEQSTDGGGIARNVRFVGFHKG